MNLRNPSFRVLAACGILGLLAACQNNSESDHLHPKYFHEVALVPQHAVTSVAIERGAGLRLVLPGPPAGTDYVWEIVSNNIRVLEETVGLRSAPASNVPGSVRTTSVTFYSLKPGKSIVRFVLVRASVRDAVPVQHYQITVIVKETEEE